MMFLVVFSISMAVISSSFSSLVNWAFMELVTFFFIPVMFKSEFSASSINMIWKYFVAQGVGSFLFFVSVGSGLDFFPSSVQSVVLVTSMVLKLGIFPYSGWVFHVVENMNWLGFLAFSTMLKVVPLTVLFKSLSKGDADLMVSFLAGVSTVSVLWMMLGGFSSRVMLSISSLVNLNWMLLVCLVDEFLVLIFMILYVSMMLVVCFFFSLSEDVFSSMSLKQSLNQKSVVVTSMLFMTGLPPLGFFLVKLEMIESILSSSGSVVCLLVVGSTILSFLYLSFLVSLIMEQSKSMFYVWFCRLSILTLLGVWLFLGMSVILF